MMYTKNNPEIKMKVLIILVFTICGLLAGFLVSRIVFTPYIVRGNAMMPGYHPGQRLIFNKFGTPRYGDVVLIQDPIAEGTCLLKRVIGLSGDSIEIKNQVLYRNSVKVSAPWQIVQKDTRNFAMIFTYRDNMPLVKLARNEYFVINDTLDDSFDSRTFGKISNDKIVGTLIYTFK